MISLMIFPFFIKIRKSLKKIPPKGTLTDAGDGDGRGATNHKQSQTKEKGVSFYNFPLKGNFD